MFFLFLNFDRVLEFISRTNCQHLTNWTRWNKRDKVWGSAASLFKWRFRIRRRRCCLSGKMIRLSSLLWLFELKYFRADERAVRLGRDAQILSSFLPKYQRWTLLKCTVYPLKYQKNAFVLTSRSKVDLIWTRAIRPVIAQSIQFSKISKKLNIDLCQFFFFFSHCKKALFKIMKWKMGVTVLVFAVELENVRT